MSSINFFTPLVYGDLPVSCTQALAEYADEYFYWGGQQAVVLTISEGSQGVLLREEETSCWLTAVKVVTYFTLILPLIVLIAKVLLRCGSSFHIYREASFGEALLNGHPQLARRIKKEGIVLSMEERRLERAYNNDCNFEPADFTLLPQDQKEKIYQVANIYFCKELVLKLNICGMRRAPLAPRGPAILSCNMNMIEAESALRKLFTDLRTAGCLNTEAEFHERGDYAFFNQKVDMGALLGAEYLVSKAIDLNLRSVKIPKKIAVILPDETNTIAISVARDSLDMRLHSPDLQIVTEHIHPLAREETEQERAEIEALKNATGYRGATFVVGRNSQGEEGIFCMDTGYENFDLPPAPAHAASDFAKSGFAARSAPFLFKVSDFVSA